MTELHRYMEHSGLTDSALAESVGCDRSMIAKLRAGKASPSLRLAIRIHRFTGVAIEKLATEEQEAAE